MGPKRDFAEQRARMVERQLRRRGIADERVLSAMGQVPRERFVPASQMRRAYRDGALPIGHDQTISQPWIVAAICEGLELSGSERVLEVGAGSGYSTCVLSLLAREVVAVERVPELARAARERVAAEGAGHAEVIEGDGSSGLPGRAPFDAIAVHATAPGPPPSLLEQLAPGGRLVIPISAERADMLTVFRRRADGEAEPGGFAQRVIGPTRFVPLIGAEGFD